MIEAETIDDGDESLDRVCAIADDIAETLDEFDADGGEALCALGFVVGGVLTYEVVSREAALEMLEELVQQIRAGINMAERNGSAWWVRNRAN